MGLQSTVECLLYRQCQDPMLNDWENFPAKTIGKVFKRWVKVLDIMLKDNGGNLFVEKDRGELTNDPTSSNQQCFLNFSLFCMC